MDLITPSIRIDVAGYPTLFNFWGSRIYIKNIDYGISIDDIATEDIQYSPSPQITYCPEELVQQAGPGFIETTTTNTDGSVTYSFTLNKDEIDKK